MLTVMACPICGLSYVNHCYHEPQEEVATEEMPIAKAIKIAKSYLDQLQDYVDEHQEQLNNYTKILLEETERYKES